MTDHSSDRYARQVQFGPIGNRGQQRMRDSSVVVLGAGALGTVAAEILARAGVGHLKIVDRDVVEWSNLQRQSLFEERDAAEGRSKAQACSERLAAINSEISIEPVVVDVTADSIDRCLSASDLVIDASDNFAIRFLLNDWSLSTETPWIHAGCVGAAGQVFRLTGLGQPCFRCLLPSPPPSSTVETCDTAGVIGSATHLIASLQATEAIKWLSGNEDAMRTKLISIDLWNNRIRELSIRAQPKCPACVEGKLEFLTGDRDAGSARVASLCGRDAFQISPGETQSVDLKRFAQRWEGLGEVQSNPFFVRLHHNENENLTLFRDGRVVVSGISEASEARSLYDRYVGG